jgi:hypothetical protein
VEQQQIDAGLATDRRQLLLRYVERPRRRQDPGVLPRVGVAEHHLLPPAARGELPGVDRVGQQRAQHLRRPPQVVERFEQRHHVDARGRRVAREVHQPRLARQQQHAQQVLGRGGHRHDVGARRRRAGLLLHGADDAEGVEHAARRVLQRQVRPHQRAAAEQLAAERVAVEGRHLQPRRQVDQRRRVGVGVVAHVHAVAVQPVRAHQRQERVQHRAARLHGAGREQRVAHQVQVRLQRRRVGVGRRLEVGTPGVARGDAPPRRVQPRRHEGELEADRLVGVAAAVRLPDVGERRPVGLQRRRQRLGGRRQVLGHRRPLDERLHPLAVAPEDRVARAARRRQRHLGRHERVAVAVPAHPRPQPHRRRQPQRVVGVPELVGVGAHQRLVRPHPGVEQPRLQVPQHGAHLVEHRGAVAPHLGGQPEQLDLPLQRLVDRAPVVGRRLLAPQQLVGHARLQRQQRAPRRLRGVRGEHRAHVEPAQRVGHRLGAQPAGAQPPQRPPRGARLRLGVVPVGLAPPHAVHLLRRVDEQEEEGERARRQRRQGERQRLHARQQRVERRRRRVPAAARPRGAADRLHRLERLLPLQPADDAPERGGEAAHVLVQRLVLGARGRRGRDGGGHRRGAGKGTGAPFAARNDGRLHGRTAGLRVPCRRRYPARVGTPPATAPIHPRPVLRLTPRPTGRLSGALLVLGGLLGAAVPVLHPMKVAGYYSHPMTGPSHLLLLAAVLVVSLGLPGLVARQPDALRPWAALGAAGVFVGEWLLDGTHGVVDGAVLPAVVHAAHATGADPRALVAAVAAGPLGVLTDLGVPVMILGCVTLGAALVRGSAASGVPRWAGVLVASCWALFPLRFVLPAVAGADVALPYVALLVVGASLWRAPRGAAARAAAPAVGAAAPA